MGDDHEGDPDYELTDLTEGGSSTQRSGDPGVDTSPPGFEGHVTTSLRAVVEQEESTVKIETLKAQCVVEAQESLYREFQKRVDEMFDRRLSE